MLRIFRVVGAVTSFGSKSDSVFYRGSRPVRESSCPGKWAHCFGLSPRFPRWSYGIIINCPWGSGRDHGEVEGFYGEGNRQAHNGARICRVAVAPWGYKTAP